MSSAIGVALVILVVGGLLFTVLVCDEIERLRGRADDVEREMRRTRARVEVLIDQQEKPPGEGPYR